MNTTDLQIKFKEQKVWKKKITTILAFGGIIKTLICIDKIYMFLHYVSCPAKYSYSVFIVITTVYKDLLPLSNVKLQL